MRDRYVDMNDGRGFRPVATLTDAELSDEIGHAKGEARRWHAGCTPEAYRERLEIEIVARSLPEQP